MDVQRVGCGKPSGVELGNHTTFAAINGGSRQTNHYIILADVPGCTAQVSPEP